MLEWAFAHPFLTTIILVELIVCVQNIFLCITRIVRGYPKEKSETSSGENGGKNVEIDVERIAVHHPVCDPEPLYGETAQHTDKSEA